MVTTPKRRRKRYAATALYLSGTGTHRGAFLFYRAERLTGEIGLLRQLEPSQTQLPTVRSYLRGIRQLDPARTLGRLISAIFCI
jgi:hypothetical protein